MSGRRATPSVDKGLSSSFPTAHPGHNGSRAHHTSWRERQKPVQDGTPRFLGRHVPLFQGRPSMLSQGLRSPAAPPQRCRIGAAFSHSPPTFPKPHLLRTPIPSSQQHSSGSFRSKPQLPMPSNHSTHSPHQPYRQSSRGRHAGRHLALRQVFRDRVWLASLACLSRPVHASLAHFPRLYQRLRPWGAILT